jgi:pilus assembly protein Flp/PilA
MVQYLQILLNARFAKMEERGASAVEYGLLVALIAAAIILAVTFLGNTVKDVFNNTGNSIANHGTASS